MKQRDYKCAKNTDRENLGYTDLLLGGFFDGWFGVKSFVFSL